MNPVRWRTSRPLTSLCLGLSFFLAGCGTSLLLDKDIVEKMTAPSDDEPHVIYCQRTFAFTSDGMLLDTTYTIVRMGVHPAEYPRVLAVEEDANSTILDVEGRVIHTDGSSTRIGRDEFLQRNLSSGSVISDKYVRAAAVPDRLQTGDLVETVSLVQHSYPLMGLQFSPADLRLAADNVKCTIQMPVTDSLQFALINAHITPDVQSSPAARRYVFQWGSVRRAKHVKREMAELNRGPALFAARSTESWNSFGDWYLSLIGDKLRAGTALSDTAQRITEGKASPREKMDAIFNYCQRAIRYEQVYLAHGEFVPNAADLVFENRFGDCKDYATLMYAMARSVGVETQLTLCYRGRGIRLCKQVPVMQFNHMILHLDDGGKDRWYDATDRLGTPGTTSFDLANAPALILEKGRSRLATIEESLDNLMDIEGTLSPVQGHDLRGSLTVTFSHQYATEFLWNEEHLNPMDMKDMLVKAVTALLNQDMQIDQVHWRNAADSFAVEITCLFPNATTTLGDKAYVSASRLFPNLLPDDIERDDVRTAYFFPFFNRVAMHVQINAPTPFSVECKYQLPAGPFDDSSRPEFLTLLKHAWTSYTHSYLLGKESR